MPTKIAHVSSYTKPNVSCSHPHGSLDYFNTGTITIGNPNPCLGTVNESGKRFALVLSSDAGITAGKHIVITYNASGCVTNVSVLNGATVLHALSFELPHLEMSSRCLELDDAEVDLARRRRWIRLPRLAYDLEFKLFGIRVAVSIGRQQPEDAPDSELIRSEAHDESAPGSARNGSSAASPSAS